MAKGDTNDAKNAISQQGGQAQGYLSGVQNQAGQTYNNTSSLYGGKTTPTINPVGGTPTTTSGGGGQWSQDVFNQMFPGSTISSQQLLAAAPELAKYGAKPLTNASGITGKIQLSDGSIIDVMQAGGAGGGTGNKQYLTGPTGGGSGGMMGMSGMSGVVGQNLADYSNIMGQYGEFAKTGGFTPQALAEIRSRAVSPIRSMYSSAREGLDRQRSLQGGYSPGYSTALARMTREQGQSAADASTNAEAAIAQMVQQGRLAGMGGEASMYGATPGLSNMFGNQMLTSQGQQIQLAGLQNQLGLGLINANINKASIPSNWQQALNNITGGSKLAGGLIPGASDALSKLGHHYDPTQPPGPNNDPGRQYDQNPIDGGYEPIPGVVYGGSDLGNVPYVNPYGPTGYGNDPSYGNSPSNPYIPGTYQPYDPNNPAYQL